MKKALLLLLAAMLVGCSGEETEKKKDEVVKEEKVVPVKYEEVNPESKAEVEKFVKKYNVRVDVYKQETEEAILLEKIPEPITSDLNEEKKVLSQILLETDFNKFKGHYKIVAKYNKDKKITGYNISVEGLPENEVNEDGDEWGEGIAAAISVAQSLGLNIDKFIEAIGVAEEKGTHSYVDSNYKVTALFTDIDLGKFEINYDLSK
ncbi:hypothetical protein [Lysinibacillus sp. fls2-241-R2A-57]|uniref:hypothetical protein n=1 Tax=Lysinibacillus sp. fls2-241-R2A-57 TaxID=3040292 RepID=UPI0025522C46|nr:hypothetical protein [Lysinibacillus sp. fls2-241-R2A-57]